MKRKVAAFVSVYLLFERSFTDSLILATSASTDFQDKMQFGFKWVITER